MFDIVSLPARPQSARFLSLSLLIHGATVLLLFTLRFPPGISHPLPGRLHVFLIAPPLSAPSSIAQHFPIAPPVPIAPRAPHITPRPFHPLAPAVLKLAPALPAAPLLEAPLPLPLKPELALNPVAPPPPLKTDNLANLKPAAPAPARRIAVKAAGFAGVDASTPGASLRAGRGTSSATGSFDIAGGMEPAHTHAAVARTGGFSQAAVANIALSRGGVVRGSGFDDLTASNAVPVKSTRLSANTGVSQVEILSKPRPEYTEEARRLRIEGEVLLELLFGASGDARVIRVVHGLGHGLDENAIAVARAIRFRPAHREGVPVDSSAVVHLVFELAY